MSMRKMVKTLTKYIDGDYFL